MARRSDGGLAMLDQKSCYAIAYARNNTPKEKIFGIDIESQKHYIFFKRKMNFMMFFSIKRARRN